MPIIITVYIYGLLPFLIGTAVSFVAKCRIDLPIIYVSGYIIYLSLFDFLIIWETHNHASFSHLSHDWKLIILILTILGLTMIGLNIIIIRKKHKLFSEMIPHFSQKSLILLGLTLFLTLLSILLLVPQPLDETPELARITLASDSFFSLDPFTGAPFVDSSAHPGYLHLFYAFGSVITGINVTTLIHLLMPLFMIPLFVCTYITISRILFPNEARSRDRFRFVCLIILFYLLMLPLEAHVTFAPYRNIWNGSTLAASCLLPLFIVVCLDLTRHFSVSDPTPVVSTPTAIIGLIFIALAIRLCIPYGTVLCGLFILATILIILFKKLWRKQADSDSCSNTKGGEQS